MTPLTIDNACDAIRDRLRHIQGTRLLTWPQEREMVCTSMADIAREALKVVAAIEYDKARDINRSEPL